MSLASNITEGIGDAAFYGPKLDVQVANVLGKDETISTVQLDFTLPERFGLEYIGEDGQAHRPVMVHRGVLSTMERFMAFLDRKLRGQLPGLARSGTGGGHSHRRPASGLRRRSGRKLRGAGLRIEVDGFAASA